MIAIVVVRGPSPEMAGLAQSTPVPLLPLGDRPVLQHLIEYLVLQGVLQFELILEESAERIEAYLGTGARWGCRIAYHRRNNAQSNYRAIADMPLLRNEPRVFIYSEKFPYFSLAPYVEDPKPTFFVCGDVNDPGMALFPRNWRVEEQITDGRVVTVSQCVDTTTAGGILAAQRGLLDGTLDQLLIGGTETQPGVRMARNVALHPSVELIAPVYVGPNCRIEQGARIGPHAVIAGQCLIDAKTSIRNSLVLPDGYVGQNLELDGVIVDRNLLVNAQLRTDLLIQDPFLLSGFDRLKLRR